jgi:hypothetical protein
VKISTDVEYCCFVVMSNSREIEIQNIDHLGIVAGIIDSIGLVGIINELIGQEPGEKISAGHVVKAMILNGLGFVSSPLYMFSEFFQDKPCELLSSKCHIVRGYKNN